jgi:hypothetical protein
LESDVEEANVKVRRGEKVDEREKEGRKEERSDGEEKMRDGGAGPHLTMRLLFDICPIRITFVPPFLTSVRSRRIHCCRTIQ